MTDNDDDDQKIYCISKHTIFSFFVCVSQSQSFIRNAFILSSSIKSYFSCSFTIKSCRFLIPSNKSVAISYFLCRLTFCSSVSINTYKEGHRDRITSDIQRNMANIHIQEERKRDVDYIIFWQEWSQQSTQHVSQAYYFATPKPLLYYTIKL